MELMQLDYWMIAPIYYMLLSLLKCNYLNLDIASEALIQHKHHKKHCC